MAARTPVNGTLAVPLSDLGQGASQTVVITLVANLSGGGPLINTARVAGNVADTKPANNSVTTSTPLLTADLVVTIDDGEDFATVGVDLTYTITVANNDVQSADVILTYTLPQNVSLQRVVDDAGVALTYRQVGNVLTFFEPPAGIPAWSCSQVSRGS